MPFDLSTSELIAYFLGAIVLGITGVKVFKHNPFRVVLPEEKAKTTLAGIIAELEDLANETFDLNYTANKEAIEEIQDRAVKLLHVLFMMDGKITPEEQAILDNLDIRELKELLVDQLKKHIK